MFENIVMAGIGVVGIYGAVRGLRSFYDWAYWRGFNSSEEEQRKVSKYDFEQLTKRVETIETKRRK